MDIMILTSKKPTHLPTISKWNARQIYRTFLPISPITNGDINHLFPKTKMSQDQEILRTLPKPGPITKSKKKT
jgi:hypothetical protein